MKVLGQVHEAKLNSMSDDGCEFYGTVFEKLVGGIGGSM